MSMRIKINELDLYDATHSVKLLGKFYWDIEQYLEQLNICLDETKVNVAAMFLTRNTKLW